MIESIKLQIGTIPLRRRARQLSSELSIEIPPESPVTRSPERRSPSTSHGQELLQPMMDFLSVTAGPSRRASAPPLWLESEISNEIQADTSSNSSAPDYANIADSSALETRKDAIIISLR